jgi:hypothetical protein
MTPPFDAPGDSAGGVASPPPPRDLQPAPVPEIRPDREIRPDPDIRVVASMEPPPRPSVREPVSEAVVHAHELEHYVNRRRRSQGRGPVQRDAVGLSLSGGGIRSASFNLGLLAALGNHEVLDRVDYLSTVSGGGYIGSCLSALCDQEGTDCSREHHPFRPGEGQERAEVKHLRRHGNYLMLHRGDIWRFVGNYVGGLVVTWLTVLSLFVPLVVLGLAFADGFVLGFSPAGSSATNPWTSPADNATALFAPAFALLALWALMGAGVYVAAALVPSVWTIQYRRRLFGMQGLLLKLAVGAAIFGALPFVLVGLRTYLQSEHRLSISAVTAAVSLISLLGSRVAGAKGMLVSRELLFSAGALVLVAGLLLAATYVTWWLCRVEVIGFTLGGRPVRWDAVLIAAGLVTALVLAVCTDINRASMFFFYRDRLSEAFIFHVKARAEPAEKAHLPGAAHGEDTPPSEQRETSAQPDIVNADDLPMADLADNWARAPYHLVNAAVNLPGSRRVELRGRRAEPFLISPLYTGSRVTNYAPTAQYEGGRVNLASAMAVSGAAANPSYGRATRPTIAFLMALLNVRLGTWVANPRHWRAPPAKDEALGARARHQASRLARPLTRLWPLYLMKELLGRLDERGRSINVSDGGHVENLGAYELLRRRCALVIASDAGADPDVSFGDLANLMRMARIDFGIQILIEPEELRPARREGALEDDPARALSRRHAITGRILYPACGAEPAFEGTLVYTKSSLLETDPADLLEYKRSHPDFPHEPTSDQFFDEAQFEAYRELGYQCGRAVGVLAKPKLAPVAVAAKA